MLKDNLQNIDYYNYLSQDLCFGLEYLKNTDFSSMQNGKYEIKEGKVFAIVQDYMSKPELECQFEAHRKYTDIQFIVQGEEKIGIGKLEDFKDATEYDKEKDIVFLKPKDKKKFDYITLKTEEFAIFAPHDAHMPSLALKVPKPIKKVVVKVLI